MTRPTRQDTAGQAYLDLQNLARREKRPTDQLLVLYVVERFLARLAASPLADRFVLKGGMLLAVWHARRTTADGDLLARNLRLDPDSALAYVRQIASTPPPVEDGVQFLPDTAKASVIREGALYEGVRVSMQTRVARAPVKLSLDISTGDPVTPAPERFRYPSLRHDHPDLDVLGYPLAVVLSEKICTAVQLLTTSTRVRDYADIWTLTRTHAVDAGNLLTALHATARHRQIRLTALAPVLSGFGEQRQTTYRAYRRRLGPDADNLPDHFTDVLKDVTHFTDPLLTGTVTAGTWQTTTHRWT
jgi:hypothetical protein